jgi:hypothetical protein
MPTRLERPLRRVVRTRRHGELVLTLTAEGLLVRELGRRTTYGPLDYGALLLQGARQYVADQKAAKAAARKAAKAARGDK